VGNKGSIMALRYSLAGKVAGEMGLAATGEPARAR